MQTTLFPIGLIKVNENNPRKISKDKFDKLIDSILVFPKMLEIRPIVIDKDNIALGGNMRTLALLQIARDMTMPQIKARLENVADYQRMTDEEQKALAKYWAQFIAIPHVPIVKAESLTDNEIEQFIVKDNASFGQWDFDMLSSMFDEKDLDAWGLDVWQMDDATREGDENAEIGEAKEDEFDEEKDHIEVRCKRGDIWELGEHRLMCGDSIDLEDVKKLMGGG